MLKNSLVLVFYFLFTVSFAQNLIQDGSFEDNKTGTDCDYGLHLLSNTWKGYGTCELMRNGTCATLPNSISNIIGTDTVWSVDYWGSQKPQHGAYQAGIRMFYDGIPEWHEFIYTPLIQPLDSGRIYLISYYVSPAESEDFISNSIGVGFSKSEIPANLGLHQSPYDASVPRPYFFYDLPHVMYDGNTSLNDYVNWIKLDFKYKSIGGEKYLVIGNFSPDNQTHRLQTRFNCNACGSSARFFIDNVTVEECQLDYFSFSYDSILLCKNGVFEVDLSSYSDSIIWMDGSTEKIREISETGVYTVTYTNGICTYSDSFHLYRLDTIRNIEDVIVCNKNEFPIVFSPQVNYHSENNFFLNGQSINSFFSIYESGNYEFKVTNDDCYIKQEFKVVNLEELSAFYPNPSNGIFQIDNPLDFTLKAKVYDLSGRIIEEVEILDYVDLSNLSDGVYLIVFDEDCLETRKVIVKK